MFVIVRVREVFRFVSARGVVCGWFCERARVFRLAFGQPIWLGTLSIRAPGPTLGAFPIVLLRAASGQLFVRAGARNISRVCLGVARKIRRRRSLKPR